MNFSDLNLDLQGVVKRAYENLLYRSSFMKLVNTNYIGELRQTGVPMIEVAKSKAVAPTKIEGEITNAITPTLATYDSVKVDLTELRLTYSVNVSPLVQNAMQSIADQVELQDSENAEAIDKYGYDKLAKAITGAVDGSEAATKGQTYVFNFDQKDDYINAINTLKAYLFNRKVYAGYKLGLEAMEYAKLVSALTSILKYETATGIEGVDRGIVANAYGVEIFEIASSVLTNGEVGYFASEIGTVGDAFFSQFNQWNGDRPGFPGYFSIEGIVMFGAEVVRPEAVIKLVSEVSM